MSHETKASGRSRKWPRRRVLGVTLGLAVVVGSGAAANASAHGDGFLKHGAFPTAPTASANGYTGHSNGMNQRTTRDGTSSWSASSTGTSGRYQGTRGWGTGWTWNGKGTNRWAFRPLVDRADTSFNQALGINNRGLVVGYFGSGEDDQHPNHGWWTSSWGSRFRGVDFPGAMQTQAVGVNDEGTVVGFYVEGDGSNHGFVRWHGRYMSVDAPWTTSTPAFNQLLGISRNGIAAGFYNDRKGNAHGYLFNTRTHRFTPVRLPWHAATSVTVTGVSDTGTVVGFAVVKKQTVAFVITKHTVTLVKLGNGMNTQVLGVNRAGVVVGSFEGRDGRTHGFTWTRGRVRTVDAPWATSTVVNGLNDSGQIVGFFERGNGITTGFVAKS